MDALAAAHAARGPVSDLGGRFMLNRATFARGAELGFQPGFEFYVLGRFGVLGEVAADVVAASAVFINPDKLAEAWTAAVAIASPDKGAALYNDICQSHGRTHLAAVPDLDGFVALAEVVLAQASMINAPIAAGWRALPRATDVPGRSQQLLQTLRELRMARHGVCIHAEGLTPLEAIIAGPGGAANAKMFGWPEPFPDAAPLSARRAAAEARTDQLSAVDFAHLTDAERDEFVAGLGRILEHATK
ncbi:MAG: hypothetical protein ABIQ73_02210 [Acidimicrobiales bacterium]